MSMMRLRNEIARLKGARPPRVAAPLSETQIACKAAGLIAEHQERPNSIGQRVLEILTTAKQRLAGLI